ncbi:MAG: carboxypeptidase regulatory-like domain-containing protein [Bacteroidota bacterium]
MNTSIKTGLFGLLLLTFFACQEETIEPNLFGSIAGEVVLSDGNIPVDMATISTTPATSSLFTDDFGRFAFDSIVVGSYTLRAEKEGYVTQLENVTVFENQTATVIIQLELDTLVNNPPTPPMNPIPADGANDQLIDLRLTWTAADMDDNDVLMYTVELFEGSQNQGETVLFNSTDTFVDIEGLKYNTTYFWQVEASDGQADPVFGATWRFKTQAFPDHRFLFTRKNEGRFDIYSSDESGAAIRLTNNGANNWRPRMSPTRDKIAFISSLGIEPQLYVMDRDGSNVQQVTTIPIAGFNNLDLDFSWSPDGSQLLYMNNNMLYRINQDGTGLNSLVEAPSGLTFTECDWSGQVNRILARATGEQSYNSHIYIIQLDGTYEIQIVGDEPGSTEGAVYSINGTKILYTYDVSGFESSTGRQLDARIFQKDVNSLVAVDLSFDKIAGTNDFDVRYSPDGAKVIFTNTNNDGISRKDIWIMDLDGDNRMLLFENAEMPDWR